MCSEREGAHTRTLTTSKNMCKSDVLSIRGYSRLMAGRSTCCLDATLAQH